MQSLLAGLSHVLSSIASDKFIEIRWRKLKRKFTTLQNYEIQNPFRSISQFLNRTSFRMLWPVQNRKLMLVKNIRIKAKLKSSITQYRAPPAAPYTLKYVFVKAHVFYSKASFTNDFMCVLFFNSFGTWKPFPVFFFRSIWNASPIIRCLYSRRKDE